jgi:DNA helicase-2/ATP-dependent DNA helicase PcrA
MLSQCSEIIRAMKNVDRRIGITYMMQVWLALFLIKNPPFEIGFVDECQDLSPARLALSLKLAKNLVFVGDNNQAINGWNGADPHSMERIREYCAAELPLRLSFRLPPNVAALANQIRPTAQIRTMDNKKDGVIGRITPESLLDWTRDTLTRLSEHHDSKDKNPMVVCRYNAPLVKLALQYVKAGIPCKSLGGSLIKNLISTVANRRATSIDDLMLKLAQYEARTLEVGNAMAKQANKDKFDCIRHVLKSCNSLEDFEPMLKRLLQPPKGTQHVILTTVHKAKGLEAKVVALLNPPIPSSKAETPDQIEQEKNVDFVAHTRTKSEMYYLFND